MNIIGLETIQSQLTADFFELKAVFNDKGIIFFPATAQHRTMKAEGISYDDDSAGNALAAMMKPGRFEIRRHGKFSAERVGGIVKRLRALPELDFLKGWTITYVNADISSKCV